MDLRLDNKVVLVSGGAGRPGSVGETIVRSVAEEGGVPVIVDIDTDRGEALASDLSRQGRSSLFIGADLTVPEDCQQVVARTLAQHGRIDTVINNLGVNDGVGLDGSVEDFIASLRLNLVHMFSLVKYSLEALKTSGGNILNVGSKVALTGQGATSGYVAAKGGALALTREWAVELAPHGIRSNAVVIAECWTPAYDDWISTREDRDEILQRITNRIPLGKRMTRPQEIADLALFLISERASHITGQHVFIDGGYVHLDRASDDLRGH